MSEMTILVDMDDVIEELGIAWVTYLNEKYNQNVNWYENREYDFHKVFPTLTEDQIYGPLTDPDMWETVKAKEDAVYYVNKLITEGYDVHILTSARYDSVEPKVVHCLLKYFPKFDYGHIIVAKYKQMIKGDILIDDNINNFGGQAVGVLFSSPHNLDITNLPANVVRADNWAEVYGIISTIKLLKN